MIADLVFEITATAGTGPFVLGGARSADFRTFAAAHTVGAKIFYAVKGGGQWEVGEGTLTSATALARTTVFNGSAGPGVPVDFAAGNKDLYETLNSGAFLDIDDLSASSALADDDEVLVRKSNGDLATILGSIMKASGTGGTAPADTTGPTLPDALSSTSVTQTTFRLNWQAATDTNGIQRYDYSFDGTSWFSAGTALFVDITGRTAGASYTMHVRALDPAGNPSTVRTLVVVMQAASGGTNAAPAMSGSLTISNQSSSGYTIAWPAATDADGNLAGYDYSIDGGTTFTQLGNVLSINVTGRPASTTDQVRVRARDALALTSNVLSATATTTAAATQTDAQKYAVTVGPNFPTTAAFEGGTAPNQYFKTAFNLYAKATDNTFPAATALKFAWTKSGNTAPPVAFSSGAWGTAVAYATNGGNSGTVPNSVKPSMYTNASYPGLFQPDATVYGGGSAGNYRMAVLFPDGSYTIFPTDVAVA